MDENILDVIFGVKSEIECKNLCTEMDKCSWYTFFYHNSSVSHDTCTLLTQLAPLLQTSNEAISGPSDCSIEPCTLLMNGGAEGSTALMLTDTSTDVRIDVIVQDQGSCELTIFSVGAGGNAYNGGAGSGYLQYQSLTLQPGLAIINATVGEHYYPSEDTSSKVFIHQSGSLVNITAEGGQAGKGDSTFGGDGFSGGGGGFCTSDGGSDGSDGGAECNNAGYGTGEDISNYILTSWTLTPGAGGDYYSPSQYLGGGGGGGVMVNGLGPEATHYHGRGYGGGGGGFSKYGLQGVILLEVVKGQQKVHNNT